MITNFTLTHGSDTITFAIANTTPYTITLASGGMGLEFDYLVPITVNGTTYLPYSPYAEVGVSTQRPAGVGAELSVEYVTGTVNGVPSAVGLFEEGPQIFTDAYAVPVFTPETVTFGQNGLLATGSAAVFGSGDTLVITQRDTSVSAVPEPTSIAFVGNGAGGCSGCRAAAVCALVVHAGTRNAECGMRYAAQIGQSQPRSSPKRATSGRSGAEQE